MDGLLTLTLEAHNPAENRHRWYEVRVGRNLFGEWTVCLAYGRAGRAGHERRFTGPGAEELQARVRDHLLRRLSAPRRIGCPYRVTGTRAAAGLDAPGWLPPDLMARFTPAVRAGATRATPDAALWSCSGGGSHKPVPGERASCLE